LAQILGASARRNRFGELLGLRRWFSDVTGGEAMGGDTCLAAPEGELDAAALRLLAPRAAGAEGRADAARHPGSGIIGGRR